MAGVKGRSGGYRAGAGRRPGSVTLTSKKAKAKLKAPSAASVAVLKTFIVRKSEPRRQPVRQLCLQRRRSLRAAEDRASRLRHGMRRSERA